MAETVFQINAAENLQMSKAISIWGVACLAYSLNLQKVESLPSILTQLHTKVPATSWSTSPQSFQALESFVKLSVYDNSLTQHLQLYNIFTVSLALIYTSNWF